MQDPRYVWAGVAAVTAVVLLVLFLLVNRDDGTSEADRPTTTATTTTVQETSTSAQPESTTTETSSTSVTSSTTTSSDGPEPTVIRFTFDDDTEGWEPGFADLPDEDQEFYELEAEWRELPTELGEGGGLFSSGQNRSDDLLMYWFASVEGLTPSTSYLVETTATLGTNVPSGLVGIGGSPTEAVFVKAAVSAAEPLTEVDDLGFVRLTIDIGAASEGGANGRVIGTLDNPDVDGEAERPPFAPLILDGNGVGVVATSDPDGRLWLLFGIDSGFEGRTVVYVDQLDVTFTPADA